MFDEKKKRPNKIIRLVEYLTQLARINSRIVRNLDEYKKTLWVYNIPHEPKHCFTRVWGQEDEHDGDVWIEVKKFPEPELPKIPQKCSNWVNQKTLRNTKNQPELFDSIFVENSEIDRETGEEFTFTDTLYLKNQPEIRKSWNRYLKKRWRPWTELYNRYTSVQKVYADMFHIYQELQKLGEQYELVFCKGFLNWKTPNGQEAKRHIIVAKASLEFEPQLGIFTVRQATNGEPVDIELDMLDVKDQPQNARQLAENGRNAIGANLWDRANIDAILESIANSLADGGQGEYHPERLEPKQDSPAKKPSIEFAPALILRKRSMRGLEKLLVSIKEQIKDGEMIPDEFLDLCESLPEKTKEPGTGDSNGISLTVDVEIFFPLPANDEQRRIIHTLDRQKGVLVKGPPGTGKSHTIANLICHLLATGKRVLVTAKTPRALKVLHDKLPPEIKPLCINLLGQGTEERKSLEKSVSGILTRLDRREESSNNNNLIQELKKRIQKNREKKAKTDNKIMALRESETFKHDNIANGRYSGTAAQIARDIRKDDEEYAWFTDTISSDDTLPLSQVEIKFLCRYIVEIDQEKERKLSLLLPDVERDLPEVKVIRIDFQKEAEAKKKAEVGEERLNSQKGKALLHAGKEEIEPLLRSLSDFNAASETIRQRPMAWIEKAVNDVLTDMDTPWKELLMLSRRLASDIHDLAAKVYALDISIPQGMDRKKILNDAKALKAHFESGGRAGVWIFKPKAIREHGDIIGQVKVDGLDCNSADALQKLINFLTVEIKLNDIWSLWSGKAERLDGPFPLQLAEIIELHEALESIINLYYKREEAKEKLSQINGLRSPRWEDITSLDSLVEDCRVVLAKIDYLAINSKLVRIQNRLLDFATKSNSHPINVSISKAFVERDTDEYCKLFEEITQLSWEAKDMNKKKQAIRKLAETAPNLARHLTRYCDTLLWSKRLNQLDMAWAWAQGKAWLNDFLKDDDVESLERHRKRLDEDIRKDLADLSAIKAWQFCFTRMQEHHRRHLIAWQQSMKKLGKGTGKHAHTHRKNAQRHLNECKEAVPAWIMPLHRVYDTVEAGPGIFDIIIVDEASQCGPEGLPLMYLGKRILIVGDDQQISPEGAGILRDPIQRLMQEYLSDFEYADSFDVENSLFDHGSRFSSSISLREHFRCMPEIIRFSNDLCYFTDPLIPLRQYLPDRLEPLKHVYVKDGNREGSGQGVINRPEAEALVDAIEKCCQDGRYKGKTMGVIALQGKAQAYLIEGKLLQRIGAGEMEKRRLICGNPYSFQGDERNIIFLSMVAAPNERIGAFTTEKAKRRFNVAASRAQDQMWLFYSVTRNHLSVQCFRRRLLEHFLDPMSHISRALGENAEELREMAHRANRLTEKAPAPFDTWFEVDVALQIAGQGYRVVPQNKVAGKRIDLVVQGEKSQLAVECDGDFWHGHDEYIADMERQRKLERCGWHFFRIRESRYFADPVKSLEPLWLLLDGMGINPLTTDSKPVIEGDETDSVYGGKPTIENKNTRHQLEKVNDPVVESSPKRNIQVASSSFYLPVDIHQALRVKADVICKAIIQVLEQRPKFSCVREKVPTYILKLWNIRSRGKPRKRFSKRVDRQIESLAQKGYVIVYKSKNVRVKLDLEKYHDR